MKKPDRNFKQISQRGTGERASRRVLYEVILILVITFIAQFLWRNLSILIACIPTTYLFVERYLRRRTWKEIGFNFRAIPRDMLNNWFPILLVSFIIQPLVFFVAKNWLPDFLNHIVARLPLGIDQLVSYLPVLLIGALWEEINYRTLFQDRLSWFISMPAAIGITSFIFGIGHWATGNPLIVGLDILLVSVDSVLYGIIFARSKNVYVSWIAHFLANLVSLTLFTLLK